ncbi:hypothetical protein [Nonomuraea rubra]|uniref:hypothetical protein n=1 Tax=Nonomuraea rubra TaxID=46180 RepID=UPI0031E9A193
MNYTDVLKVECPHGDEPAVTAPNEPARVRPAASKVDVPKLDTDKLKAARERGRQRARRPGPGSVRVPRPPWWTRSWTWPTFWPGMTVLEPSAGTGNIALAAVERGAVVDCVEIDYNLATVLTSRVPSANATSVRDFLDVDPPSVTAMTGL